MEILSRTAEGKVLRAHNINLKHYHVCIVLPHLGLGGSQKQAIELVNKLEEAGLSVAMVLTDRSMPIHRNQFPSQRYFLARWWAPAPLVLVGALPFGLGKLLSWMKSLPVWKPPRIPFSWRLPGIQVLPGVPEEISSLGYGTSLTFVGLRRILKKMSPRLVISFLPKTNVLSIHAAPDSSETWVCERNDPCRQRLGVRVESSRRRSYSRADRIWANSRHALDDLNELFPREVPRWMPNFTDFEDTTKATSPSSRIVAYVGRMHAQKRVDDLIWAFSDSEIWKPNSDWQLELFGDGPLLPALKELSRQTRAASAIIFHGLTAPTEAFFSQISFCVIPSAFEGHPNVLDEAVSNGAIPLISSQITEAQYIFEPEVHREIVFSSREELARLLKKCSILSLNDKSALFNRVRNSLLRDASIRREEYESFLRAVLEVTAKD